MDVSWAFVCDASSPKALEAIRRLKPNHPKDRPFSLVCDSISMAAHLARIDNVCYPWLKKALPGPFTVILERSVSLPKIINDKRRELGLRIPNCPLALDIVKTYGKPLAASTVPEITTPDGGQVLPGFGWEVSGAFGHALDMIVDLGEESPRTETTIVDLTAGTPEIVRRGAGDPGLFGIT
jgi:tRNA threonylcarbamoyl adenosine modification protein (Sua5/YciO/YrdC/YwlC family)